MGKNEVVVFEDGELKIEVQVNPNEDTVWMTLNQIAELFERDKSAISRHISNIYKSAELDRGSTVAIFATVQNEGGRNIERRLEYYNLDFFLISLIFIFVANIIIHPLGVFINNGMNILFNI